MFVANIRFGVMVFVLVMFLTRVMVLSLVIVLIHYGWSVGHTG